MLLRKRDWSLPTSEGLAVSGQGRLKLGIFKHLDGREHFNKEAPTSRSFQRRRRRVLKITLTYIMFPAGKFQN